MPAVLHSYLNKRKTIPSCRIHEWMLWMYELQGNSHVSISCSFRVVSTERNIYLNMQVDPLTIFP